MIIFLFSNLPALILVYYGIQIVYQYTNNILQYTKGILQNVIGYQNVYYGILIVYYGMLMVYYSIQMVYYYSMPVKLEKNTLRLVMLKTKTLRMVFVLISQNFNTKIALV